jgi:hypothetical protein
MAGYASLIAAQLGIPILLLVVIIIWSGIWKALALWKSARKDSVVWFVVLTVTNTFGILDILYIYLFSEMKHKRSQSQKARRKRR